MSLALLRLNARPYVLLLAAVGQLFQSFEWRQGRPNRQRQSCQTLAGRMRRMGTDTLLALRQEKQVQEAALKRPGMLALQEERMD